MTNASGDDRGVRPATDANVPLALTARDSGRGPRQRMWRMAAVVVATVASVLLVKYALDVFLIVVVFACLAFVLHAGSQLIAESELLSPAWIVITLLIVATGVWLVLPSDTLQSVLHFERFMPKPVVAFLEWSEQRGWAQRALVSSGPRGGGGSGSGASAVPVGIAGSLGQPATASAPSSAAPAWGITVTVTTPQATVRVGQTVAITATLAFATPPAADASRTVRFLDGGLQIGTAPLQVSGNVATASLTTAALLVGTHSIAASYAGPGLFGRVTSRPVTVVVTQ